MTSRWTPAAILIAAFAALLAGCGSGVPLVGNEDASVVISFDRPFSDIGEPGDLPVDGPNDFNLVEQPDIPPDGVAGCDDQDQDGFGIGGACRGPDCNDRDRAITNQCYECVGPDQRAGCTCTPGSEPLPCDLVTGTSSAGPDGVCHLGQRTCSPNSTTGGWSWGACERWRDNFRFVGTVSACPGSCLPTCRHQVICPTATDPAPPAGSMNLRVASSVPAVFCPTATPNGGLTSTCASVPSGSAAYTRGLTPTMVPWFDACAAPGHVTYLSNTDDGFVGDTMPFSFQFYGAPQGTTGISSNGIVAFPSVGTLAEYLNQPLPYASIPNAIFPFWDDLYQRASGGVCVATTGVAPSRDYVVEWNDGYFSPTEAAATHLTFEAILHETTNVIDVRYNRMEDSLGRALGSSATIGIQEGGGASRYDLVSYNMGPTVTTGSSIRWTPTVSGTLCSRGVYNRIFDGDCTPPTTSDTDIFRGTVPFWGQFNYSSNVPVGTSIIFELRAANTLAGLSTARVIRLPDALPGAPATPTSIDLRANLRANSTPADPLYAHRYVQITAYLNPSADGSLAPTLISTETQYTCYRPEMTTTCQEGASCSYTGSVCHAGVIACRPGAAGGPMVEVCTDGGLMPPGTTCGTGMVCDPTGSCVPCNEGAACATGSTCSTGRVSCRTGVPVCEATPLTPGTPCGGGTGSGYIRSTSATSWRDICALPGHDTYLPSVDDGSENVTIPFTFNFYGSPFTSLGISSNGMISFPWNGNLSQYSNVALPYAPIPNTIFAFWDDLQIETMGICAATLGAAPSRQYVTHWSNIHFCCGSMPSVVLDFETVLTETSNTIDVLYNRMEDPGGRATGNSATIGIQNGAGPVVDQVSFDTAGVVSSGSSIRWTPNSDNVCNTFGVCVSCTARTPCSPSSNPCDTGITDCSTGIPTCVRTGTLPPGASCGTDMVCNPTATCIPCREGASCSTGNTCEVGALSCSTGVPTCVRASFVPRNDPCTIAGGPGRCDGVGLCIPCGTAEVCDGVDTNCNGTIDEGVTRSCYSGTVGTAGIGACVPGTQTCVVGGAGIWGSCAGEVVPRTETCNSVDDDCNGTVDDPYLVASSSSVRPPRTPPQVLIYGPTGTQEQPYLPAGAMVTVASDAMWRSMTAAQFASYDLIILGDKDCSGPQYSDLQAAYDTRTTWASQVNGRVYVSALDPGCHLPAGAQTFMRTMFSWLAAGGGTALYVTGEWGRRNLDFLSPIGAFTSTGAGGDDVQILTPAHASLAGSTDSSLSGWGASYHSFITGWPTGFSRILQSSGASTLGVVRDVAATPAPTTGTCTRTVFVTSTMYTGSMGGLTGADALCQARATAGGLTGTYRAWLATSAGSPATRFNRSTVPYVLPNGTVVATSWTDLTDGTLAAPINRTELNTAVPVGSTSCAGGGPTYPTAWSGVSSNGTWAGGSACGDWTSTAGSGLWGWASDASSWSSWCSGGVCSWVSPIYCFQQEDTCTGASTGTTGGALGTSCTAGVGACSATGTFVCNSTGTATTCTAMAGTPATEICDGIDNDCDGAVDEGFCRISGVCFTNGALNPANNCQVCTVASATTSGPTSWSNVAAGTVCRASGGVCDVAESCAGTGAACPANGFVATGTVCRASAGVCDSAETCTGSSAACPAEVFVAAGTVCRAATGACDIAETCTGSAAGCPADAVIPTGTVCRASAGACDIAETCGGGASMGATVTFPSTTSTVGGPSGGGTLGGGGGGARFQTGDYVEQSFTSPSSFTSLSLNFQMSDLTSGCAVGQALSWNVLVNGTVVGTYGFTGGSGTNPRTLTPSYTFASQPAGTTTIRLIATTTVCPGGSSWNWIAGGTAVIGSASTGACPADTFLPASTVCRATAGVCDPAETCTGSAAACPSNALSAAGTVCRASAGVCDPLEACTGVAPACPADARVPAGTVCRASAGVCDVAEACDGAGVACPTNAFLPASTVCRPSATVAICDPAETCTGSAALCPADTVIRSPTTETCNAIDDDCNGVVDNGPAETCATATSLGTLSPSGTLTTSAYIPGAVGSERWFTVTIPANYPSGTELRGTGSPRINLTSSDPSIRMEVSTSCAAGASCGMTLSQWVFVDNVSTIGTGFRSRMTAWPDTVWVRLYRVSSPSTCANFTITATRPVCATLAAEVCDGIDNDCNGMIDEGFCRIGGVCFSNGALNPANNCQVCVVPTAASGATTWGNVAAGTVCRASAGVCDTAETCAGTGAACPANVFLPSSTVCRASAGVCDPQETCTGAAAACPGDARTASGTVCRASAGVCDAVEACDGSSVACPADGFLSAATVCRANNGGGCDVAETCTGAGVACPADSGVAAGTVCRAATGVCDSAEVCGGTSAACPTNVFLPSTTVCRASAGVCDAVESCTGTTATCPGDGFLPSSTVCRANNGGGCDVQETCTGTGVACPADTGVAAGTVCRSSAGVCDAVETCGGTSAACPGDGFLPSTTVCRANNGGGCDVQETCTGTGVTCPADSGVAAGTVCRAAAGVCDSAEVCGGTSAACPTNVFLPSTTVCRANNGGGCDVAESCTGAAAACPADVGVGAGTVCRPSAGICDTQEVCGATSAACPGNAFVPSTTVCRANNGGGCDVAESCTGSAAACPADNGVAAGTVCRASAGICDTQEVCGGTSAACPTNVFVPSTTVCRANNGGGCDVAENCTGAAAACPADVGIGAGTVCRPSAGICDTQEVCGATSAACPGNAFVPSTTVCRANNGGGCDVAENCTGSAAACPADNGVAAGTVCRASAGICDPQEVCGGTSAACPGNTLTAAGTVCRASAGVCDTAEACTGAMATCPGDSFLPSSTVCRANNGGGCDVQENCTGAAAACPADNGVAAGTVCRASAGVCDPQEVCGGTSAACPGNAFTPSTTVCRASAGVCDPAETCTGSAAACPGDAFLSTSTVCRASAGVCDVAEACTGVGAACPTNAFLPSSTVCRASITPLNMMCDPQETCTGAAAACPANTVIRAASTETCNAIDDDCNGVVDNGPAETCATATSLGTLSPSGTLTTSAYVPAAVGSERWFTVTIPANYPSGTELRGAGSPRINLTSSDPSIRMEVSTSCAAGASCGMTLSQWVFVDNVSTIGTGFRSRTTAWPDTVWVRLYRVSAPTTCANFTITATRPVCATLAAEVCDGIDNDCNGMIDEGFCRIGGVCFSNGALNPANNCQVCVVPTAASGATTWGNVAAGTVCRASAGVCDTAETCAGTGAACPTNVFLPSTTLCRASAGVCDPQEMCTGAAAACPSDARTASGTVCRASAGVCDAVEACDGTSVACPADGFLSAATVCRANNGGGCDVAETCTGTGVTCPADSGAAAGTVCRASAGICDTAEVCGGTSAACPTNVFLPSTTVCRANNGGGCDVAETCTGSAAACPADVGIGAGTVCRPSAGICDTQEVCGATSAACPGDVFLPSTTVCRANNGGGCDVAETCTGSAAACPADSGSAAGTVCRASAGVCDVAEVCGGTSAACPGNGFLPSTTVCRANNGGGCDVQETCTGSAAACPADVGIGAGTVCRPSAGICDTQEVCGATSAACPANVFSPSTTVCRANNGGGCDVQETCTGSAAACPADLGVAAGTVCRASAGVCDPAEACGGTSAACPGNTLTAAGTVCRASAGVCDTAEACTGSMATCPTDVFLPSTTVCRANNGGGCDVQETCTGAAAACPADVGIGAGTVCRPSAGICDTQEVCGATSAACPANSFLPSTTVCRANNGGGCDVQETCTGAAAACPADSGAAAGTVCRASAGVCDTAEVCGGTSAACPTNVFLPSTTVCRANNGGGCDVQETCTGAAAACPADVGIGAGTVCRPSAGICDTQEVCGATSAACPANVFSPSTTVCRANNGGGCDVQETCTGSAAACPADLGVAAGTVCRASAGVCDPAEACGGTSAACPGNTLTAAGTVCRASAGVCDTAEACTGVGAACPANGFIAAGTICRANNGGGCDVQETCTGAAAACPADNGVAAGTVCRASAGVCDPQEVCGGTSAACPGNTFSPSTTVCRANNGGGCDVAENCTGSAAACPADTGVAAGTICRASAGVCDVQEVCGGTSAACPGNGFIVAGAVCRASITPLNMACDPQETCTGASAACPANTVIRAASTETCNAIDDDCNGVVDNGTTTACGSAEAIGNVTTGTSTSRTGFVAAPAGSERWYSVSFTTVNGTPSISLSGATASLRIEVYTACGGTPFCSGTPGTVWSFVDNTPGTGFYTRAVAWPSSVWVRVYRTSATTTCGSYTLNVSH